jgi:hypothetical protein
MLTTNPEDNFEGVLSKKKYDEIMINFKKYYNNIKIVQNQY